MEIKDFIEAITHSCDAYFYQFGNAAGIDAIDRVGKTLGLGQPTGIELTDEVPGLLPSPDWLKTTKNERWTPDDREWGNLLPADSDYQIQQPAGTIIQGLHPWLSIPEREARRNPDR